MSYSLQFKSSSISHFYTNLPSDSYMGYSLAVGQFAFDNRGRAEYVVAGAPRDETYKGSVSSN